MTTADLGGITPLRYEERPDSPWRRLGLDGQTVNPIPSMISSDESLYLHWLAREYYRGEGEIVDGGCLLGGSTLCLATGLEANQHVFPKQGRIHSYDLFQFWEGFRGHVLPNDTHLKEGDSLLPIFLRNIQAFRKYVQVEPGDIVTKRWTAGPIEIFFIDVAKSWQIHNHLMREFFPQLIPGRSIVVHQDYFHYGCWWIHLTMQQLEEYFQVAHNPCGGTLSFRLLKKIPDEVLRQDFSKAFSREQIEVLMDRAIAPAEGVLRSILLSAKACALAEHKAFEAAAAAVEEARRVEPWDDLALYDVIHAEAMVPGDLLYPKIADASTVVAASRRYVVCRQNEAFCAVSRGEAGCDAACAPHAGSGVVSCQSLEDVSRVIGERVLPVPSATILVGSHRDYNLLWYAGRVWGVPLRLGHVDIALPRNQARHGVLCGRSCRELIGMIDGKIPPAAAPHPARAWRRWLGRLFGP